ncbi:MAG: group II intron reverse transcriptase/maturase [Solirubrobacterales bacterium]|nr:group II intron reverse transcriptase/maturase [Solirubrobacterales bacterium]
MARTIANDKTRELQRTLYRAAKADPKRRFHALFDKVHRRDVLERAWDEVRANRGAAGVDRQTIADVEEYGVAKLLSELERDLRDGSYRTLPARRVFIPKPGRPTEQRPLSIPAVRDRIVQAAVKTVIEPIFEADFAECSFGFRPRRSAHDALQVLVDEAWKGKRWVAETDIASCYEEIPHDRLMAAIEERICDRKLLKLLRAMLRAGVMQDGAVTRSVAGTPQGGVVSPVLCNVYLHRLDRQWKAHGRGVLVRYADDLLAICSSRREAQAALEALRAILGELGLRPKEPKTRIVELRDGGEGFIFLGFEHRLATARGRRGGQIEFLVRYPSPEAMRRARRRVSEITARKRLLLPVEQIVQELNLFLRGWSGYFRYGSSSRAFHQLMTHTYDRLCMFVAKRHKRGRPYARWLFARGLRRRVGLFDLHDGRVIAPRANKPWRAKPNAAR